MCCWDGTQGFVHGREALYQLSHISSSQFLVSRSIITGLLVFIICYYFCADMNLIAYII